eukprot:scaffold2441_cov121-Isochrysis_galbana.AAC.3
MFFVSASPPPPPPLSPAAPALTASTRRTVSLLHIKSIHAGGGRYHLYYARPTTSNHGAGSIATPCRFADTELFTPLSLYRLVCTRPAGPFVAFSQSWEFPSPKGGLPPFYTRGLLAITSWPLSGRVGHRPRPARLRPPWHWRAACTPPTS